MFHGNRSWKVQMSLWPEKRSKKPRHYWTWIQIFIAWDSNWFLLMGCVCVFACACVCVCACACVWLCLLGNYKQQSQEERFGFAKKVRMLFCNGLLPMQLLLAVCWGQFHQLTTSIFHVRIPQKRKKTVKLSVFFALLGSEHAKAARKTLMQLTTGFLRERGRE